MGDDRDHRVGAVDAAVGRCDRVEDTVGGEVGGAGGVLEFAGEHVEQEFGVTAGVDVTAVPVAQFIGEFAGVRQVPVVDQGDAVGGVDVERLLLLLRGRRTPGGVPDMTEADRARQRPHVTGAHHLPHLAPGAEKVEMTAGFGRGHAGRVLSPVLQEQEGVVDVLVDRAVADHADDTAHGFWGFPH